jgi:triosephosphate isomerase
MTRRKLLSFTTRILRYGAKKLHSEWDVQPPVFLVNFKAYIYGSKASAFCKEAERISLKYDVPLIVVPQLVDLARIAEETELPVFAPYIDPIRPGRGMGSVLPEAVKEAGAVGSFLNHAERPMPVSEIANAVKRAGEVGLATLVAADSPEDVSAIVACGPNMMLTEPPSLIGSGRSVGSVDGKYVSDSIAAVKKLNPKIIVGSAAGVSSGKDVIEIIRLGAEITGATSGILAARDPVNVLDDMVRGLKEAWAETH